MTLPLTRCLAYMTASALSLASPTSHSQSTRSEPRKTPRCTVRRLRRSRARAGTQRET